MKTMTAGKLKNSLIDGITFDEPITVINKLSFLNSIDSKITILPNDLSVELLDLSTSNITTLPNRLNVGNLYLANSQIIELPNDLSVKYLSLYNSKIKHIPSTIKVAKEIIVSEKFLFSISYESFLICFHFFKNVIKVAYLSNNYTANQFEQRLLLKK